MVELVDHHDVVGRSSQGCEPPLVQGLDGCEDMAPLNRPIGPDQQLPEVPVPERRAVLRQALLQDLFAVRDEQERQVAVLLAQPRVVERCHDGLPGARRRDHEVPVVAV